MQPRLVEQIRRVTVDARAAVIRAGIPEPQLTAGDLLECVRVLTQPGALDPQSASHRFILYWILMGVPWPQQADLPEGPLGAAPLISGLGSWFDALNVQPSHIRVWAHEWLVWSEESLMELAQLWRSALESL